MKKIIKALNVVTLSLLLASCGETKGSISVPKSDTPTTDKTSVNPSVTPEPEDKTVYYSVTFDLDGGTIVDENAVKTQKVAEGRWAKKPVVNPTKDHCTFLGWYDGNFEYNFNQSVYGDVNLKAKWSVNEEDKVTLTIDPNNGEDTYTVDTFIGDRINLTVPKKDGMEFSGWYIDDDDDQKFTGYVSDTAANSTRIVAHYIKSSFNYKFSVNDDGTLTITGVLNIDTVVVNIPSEISGRRVTKIGKSAFSSRISITDINISQYITEIERNAFTGCRALANITVDDNNTAFEADGGVLYNKGKTELVLCPPKNTPSSAFTVPSTVKKIGDYAFYGHIDAGISSINFNEGLEVIGKRAFYHNELLTSLNFPSTLKVIDEYAFYTPTALSTQMTIKWNDGLEEIGTSSFTGVYIKGTLTLPNTVKKIGDYAFCTPADTNCAIEAVDLPASLEYFGDGAFFYGMGIKTITLSSSNPNYKVVDDVLYSKDGTKLVWAPHDTLAFNSITTGEFTIPEGVVELMPHSMTDIDATSIVFPSTLTKIDEDAFHYNYFISSLTIPNSVTYIGEEAFMMMENLSSFTFGNGITKVPEAAFYGCTKLSSIDIPSYITEIEYEAFHSCGLSSITFHEGLKKIGDIAFAKGEGSAKTTTLVFPDSLEVIGKGAFSDQSALKSLTFGANLNDLGSNAFSGATPTEIKLTSAALSKGAKLVDNSTLISADGKKAMYCIAGYTGSLNIPEGVEEILPYTFSKVKATGLTLPSTLKKIGEGAFYSAFDYSSKLAVKLPANLEVVGEGAFYFANLGSLTLNENLVTIEASAFEMCGLSGTLTIPASVKTIGELAFGNNWSLKTVVLNEGLEEIGTEAFRGCSSLEGDIAIPSTVKTVGEGAFIGRYSALSTSITSFSLPNGSNYLSVDNTALYNKDKTELILVPARTTVTSFTVPSTVKVIDAYAFGGNQVIKSLTLSEGLEEIHEEAFAYSPVIGSEKTVAIPSTIKSIEYRAFASWSATQKISMPFSEQDTIIKLGDDWKNSTKASVVYKA